jgi:dTMP kinase
MGAAPYVVLEGIDGAGKSTQAELLRARFAREGQPAVSIFEPTPWYDAMRQSVPAAKWDNTTKVLLLLTDRHLNVRRHIEAALVAGTPVVADRSYLSTMVYQAEQGWLSSANIHQLHSFLPQPTHVVLLHIDPAAAMQRVSGRDKALSEYETLDRLTMYSQRYHALQTFFSAMRIIDVTGKSRPAVHDEIWAALA